MMRIRLVMMAAALAALGVAAPARAQQPPAAQAPDTTRPKTTREVVFDKLRALDQAEQRDTTGADTLAQPRERAGAVSAIPTGQQRAPAPPAMDFPTDSMMLELMKLQNLTATQYRGSSAVFVADSNNLIIYGTKEEKAGVSKEGQSMTADSLLTFDQTTSVACGFGKPVLTGPGTDSPVESREVCYNSRTKVGVARGARTTVSEGANWIMSGDIYYKEGAVYDHNGMFTDCSLPYPHYHFAAKDVKVINKDVMVARNVTLNFGNVPVFWLPFFMQSMKQGRRSGILMPEFSVNDIVRRNANYNRRISNVGFYWAISDYLGSRLAMDWWSNNYTAVEGSFDYNLNDKFIGGGATLKRYWRTNGGKEFSVVANNSWSPNERTDIRADAQYATSTQFVRESSFDPRELRRQIASNAGLSRRFDWGSVSLQTSRNQFLSDNKVDWVLPSLGVNFSTVTLFPAVGNTSWYNNATWTSSAQLRRIATDFSGSDFDPSGLSGNFNSSFSMGRLGWSQSFSSNQTRATAVRAAGDSILTSARDMNWTTSLNFQQTLIGTTTFTPSVSLGGQMRSSDTIADNRIFSGPMRMDVSAALKMDLFGFWPGIGPMERLRHRISPSITYSYSPTATVNPADSLRKRFFPTTLSRERNMITIGINQTIEGKYKEDAKRDSTRADSAAIDSTSVDPTKPRRLSQARKVTILSLNTDAVTYDFVAAREGETGIQQTQISNSINSDLLRGLQLTITHELFKPQTAGTGGVVTPKKKDFEPHLSRVSASFSLSNNSFIFKMLGLGRKEAAPPATGSQETPTPGDAQGGVPSTGVKPEFGVLGNRNEQTAATPRGPIGSWNASFNITLERARAGDLSALNNQMVNTNFSFQPTQQWHVTWNTGYSFSNGKFTDHMLSFTRQMHDWDANFDFVKAQNGNFSFMFNVRLRANPDIKFDYSQRSNVPNRRSGF